MKKVNSQHIPQVCPVCGAAENHLSHTSLIRDNAMYVFCGRCKSGVITFLKNDEVGTVVVGIVTDLNLEEAQEYISSDSINSDEILSLYNFSKKGMRVSDLLNDQSNN